MVKWLRNEIGCENLAAEGRGEMRRVVVTAKFFSECKVWAIALLAIALPKNMMRLNLVEIMKLQHASLVFPSSARCLAFRLLARQCLGRADGDSMNNLAVCYALGVGTAKDDRKAFLWYKASSCAGCGYAAHSLGGCYYNGWGTSVNYELAFRAFLRAVRLGRYSAACFLGLMYSRGEYVEKSQEKSFFWYRIGALNGDANSQYDLSK